MIICFLSSYKALNVWKNSSCTRSFPAMNWISSINKTSIVLYLFLNTSFLLSFIAFIIWLVNFSEVTYRIFADLLFCKILFTIACIKWVLPKPTPPYKNNGLYDSPGLSATAIAAACAKRLLLPTTNVSKVYFGLRVLFEVSISVSCGSELFEAITPPLSPSCLSSSANTEIVQSLFVIYLKVLRIKSAYRVSNISLAYLELAFRTIVVSVISVISTGPNQVS